MPSTLRDCFASWCPTDLGGLDLTIPESVEVCRALSAYDASSGWAFIILADGALFARYLPRTVFEELYSDARSTLCGAAQPADGTSRARRRWLLFTGTANYASGCHHAALALLRRMGAP